MHAQALVSAPSAELKGLIDMLGLEKWQARALMMHFRWDVKRIESTFADQGPQALMAAAGLMRPEGAEAPMEIDGGTTISCMVCMDDVEPSQATRLTACGHAFCDDCWSGHLKSRIGEGQSRRLRCMAPKCAAVVPEPDVLRIMRSRDPESAATYERALRDSYADDNARVTWCPSTPHCGNAVRAPRGTEGRPGEPQCLCGKCFCFSCKAEPHSPASCVMFREWERKNSDESETHTWIAAHTKPCPKCGKLVEKNGGCNLVSCQCGQCFCWLCGQATGRAHTWTTIEGHTCGSFKEEAEAKEKSAASQHKRYMHYFTRWKAHMDSAGKEDELREKLEERIKSLELSAEQGLLTGDASDAVPTVADFAWLRTGLARLFRSRRVLANTYIFAFFAFGSMQDDNVPKQERKRMQELFDDVHGQMEAAVERLSGLLEEQPGEVVLEDAKGKGKDKAPLVRGGATGTSRTDAEEHDFDLGEHRQAVINLAVGCDQRCVHLYDFIGSEVVDQLDLPEKHTFAPYRVLPTIAIKPEPEPEPAPAEAPPEGDPLALAASGSGVTHSDSGPSKRQRSESMDADEDATTQERKAAKAMANGDDVAGEAACEALKRLLDMGFDGDIAGRALESAEGDVDLAVQLLLNKE